MRNRVQFECDGADLGEVLVTISGIMEKLSGFTVAPCDEGAGVRAAAWIRREQEGLAAIAAGERERQPFPDWVGETAPADLGQLSYVQVIHWLRLRGVPFKVNTAKRELVALGRAAAAAATAAADPRNRVISRTPEPPPAEPRGTRSGGRDPMNQRVVRLVRDAIEGAPDGSISKADLEAALIAAGYRATSVTPAASVLRRAGVITWDGIIGVDRTYRVVQAHE